jgi:hypothetical protein
MMNQPFSGGWRFGDRPTSVEALYQNPQAISNDFLKKVAALGQDPAKQGLLDQATTATPLTGLLEAPGSSGGGGRDVEQSAGAPSNSTGYNTNAPAMSPAITAALSATGMGFMSPLAKMAYDAVARNGFNATPGAITDPSLAFGSEAWGAAVNANAAARAARQAGVGDGLLGGPDYGGFANDFGGSSAGADSGVGAGGTNNGGYGANGGFGRDW